MTVKIFLSGKLFVTLLTLEWSLLIVHVSNVHLETGFAVEDLVATVTTEAVFTGMVEHVRLQTTSLNELFVTMRAFVWSDTSVNSHVPVQRSFEREADTTTGTSIRLFSGMDTRVFGERATGWKALGTKVALVWLFP